MPDTLSIAAPDTIAAPAAETLWTASVCHPDEAPTIVDSSARFTVGKLPWSHGIPPEPRAMLPGYDSGVICLLLAAFVLLAANFRHCSTYLKNLPDNLWSVKNRDNAFSPTHTLSETRIVLALVLIVCVMEGIVLYSTFHSLLLPPGWSVGAGVALATGVAAAYYAAQLLAYTATAHIFSTARSASLWVKGFNASQSLLTIFLTIPALWVLFNPGSAVTVAIISAVLYLLVRILFICKGFRIFYINSFSLVYFILYLCTLEIAPIFMFVKLARCFAI